MKKICFLKSEATTSEKLWTVKMSTNYVKKILVVMFDINGVFYITICSFRQISLKTKYSTQIQFKIRRHNNLIHRLDSYDKEEDSVSKETQTENVLVFQKWWYWNWVPRLPGCTRKTRWKIGKKEINSSEKQKERIQIQLKRLCCFASRCFDLKTCNLW